MIVKLNYFNYIYLDPRKPGIFIYKDVPFIFKHEPFYIGKASCIKRMKSHITTSLNPKYASGKFKCSLIKSILKSLVKSAPHCPTGEGFKHRGTQTHGPGNSNNGACVCHRSG